MELRQLRYFLAVAEELHFGRAAARMHITQPPMSQQIRRLEEELGVRLFDRSRRSVRLTRAGKTLLEEARKALAQAERVEDVARRLREGAIGQLTVGFVGSALYGPLPRMLRAFRSREPAVELSLRENVTPALVEDICDRRIDVAFVRPPVVETVIQSRVVASEPLLAAIPAGHPLCRHKQPIPLSAFAEEAFVLFARQLGPGYLDAVLQACRRAGFTPVQTYQATQIHTIVGLVAAGLGVSLVPQSVANLHLSDIAYRSLAVPVPHLQLAAISHRDAVNPTLDNFLRITAASC